MNGKNPDCLDGWLMPADAAPGTQGTQGTQGTPCLNCEAQKVARPALQPTPKPQSNVGIVAIIAFFGGIVVIFLVLAAGGMMAKSVVGDDREPRLRQARQRKEEIESEGRGHPPGGSLELLKEELAEVKKTISQLE